jgi:hypothetical protein
MVGQEKGLKEPDGNPRRAARTYALKALASVLEPSHHNRFG